MGDIKTMLPRYDTTLNVRLTAVSRYHRKCHIMAVPPTLNDKNLLDKQQNQNNEKPIISVPFSITPEIQEIIDKCMQNKKPEENKNKLVITSEKLTELRKNVENAIKERKTFTIKGGWNTIRNAFLSRGWIEKFEGNKPPPKGASGVPAPPSTVEDFTNIIPAKQNWESDEAYRKKCERVIMSRMLQNHMVDFYWNMRRDGTDFHHRINTQQIMNRFGRSLFTSKEGLNLLLQEMHWHSEPGVAHVNFPRCYTLGFLDHYSHFVDDFRLTACTSLLKWFTSRYTKQDELTVTSPEGTEPLTALEFAIKRCNEFVSKQEHADIDKDFAVVWSNEWDQFLTHFYNIIHSDKMFKYLKDLPLASLNVQAKIALKGVKRHWPQMVIDGMRNIWILKPGNKCRGRGIQLIKHLEDVSKVMNMKMKYVVQKYIEQPLLIYDTKFDIRQWFMITGTHPLTIWMYRESYLRFSTQIFSLQNFHESLHLTNHAVQCKYKNVNQRDKALPDENMWDCQTFKAYLKQIGHPDKWDMVILPGMRENIIGAMLACQDTMDRRPNTFELYGADFVISEDYTPWLLEINSSPDLSWSTSVTARMCPQCLEDMVKVIIDKRRNPSADTGAFDLVYRQNFPKPPAYLGMNLSVRGHRIFRKKLKHKDSKEIKEEQNTYIKRRKDPDNESKNTEFTLSKPKNLPAVNIVKMYKGPVIGDLIEELNMSMSSKPAKPVTIDTPENKSRPSSRANSTGQRQSKSKERKEHKRRRSHRRHSKK
ncbi:tubulin glycylase 3A-like [Agrilus planipennis]|uniref:Tubulin glycylase 3A-like n=1 Tax=Agrilus planipennis TaxID=224129 RepID=A0A1W4WKB8_AGRPL|nr:tubulin glycylase 3A-like [Agrilus planipennis]